MRLDNVQSKTAPTKIVQPRTPLFYGVTRRKTDNFQTIHPAALNDQLKEYIRHHQAFVAPFASVLAQCQPSLLPRRVYLCRPTKRACAHTSHVLEWGSMPAAISKGKKTFTPASINRSSNGLLSPSESTIMFFTPCKRNDAVTCL